VVGDAGIRRRRRRKLMKGILVLGLVLGLVPATGGAAGPPAPEGPEPTQDDRPVGTVDTVGMADPEGAHIEHLQRLLRGHDADRVVLACEAYRKEFPNGRKWIEVSAVELTFLLRSPSTMQRATDLYREVLRTYPDPAGEVIPAFKILLGEALARYGVVETARRLLHEAAAAPAVAASPFASDRLRRRLADLDAIGKPFQGFRALDLDGNLVDTSRLAGKLVLVEFWATWCGKCEEELITLEDLYREGRERGLVVIGVNVESSPEGLEEFFEKNGITWPNVTDRALDGGRISETLGVRSDPEKFQPETILIDRSGAVIRRGLHGDDLLAEVRSRL
jgi:peroxiredoxin